MNNDLERFSEEYLKELINSSADDLTIALAHIALSAKQAKPVAYMYRDNLHSDARFSLTSQIGNWSSEEISEYEIAEIPLYTAPQPAHTEQGQMPDKALSLSETIGELRKYIDSSGGYNFESLRSEQVNSPVIPDGWKLVPIEPTEAMCDVKHIGVDVFVGEAEGDEPYSIDGDSAGKVYRSMLAAAPKPESE